MEAHTHEHHHHSHSHGNKKNVLIVLIFSALYMIAEFLGGLYTNSLALKADAGHMLADVAALTLTYFAMWLSTRPAPVEKTYGYYRAEIFAAFINGIALVVIALLILYDAYLRAINPPEIKSLPMLIIAVGGLIVNIIGVYMLHQGSKENLNIKGAFIHVIGDLLGSVGAIISGILMYCYHLYIADPIISAVIALLVLYSSINLVNNASSILMESAPEHIDINELTNAIIGIDGIIDVHDLHVWSIDSTRIALSVHVVTQDPNNSQILSEVHEQIEHNFGICHTTIQIEPVGFHDSGCPLNHMH